jgi:hypothetical protein
MAGTLTFWDFRSFPKALPAGRQKGQFIYLALRAANSPQAKKAHPRRAFFLLGLPFS